MLSTLYVDMNSYFASVEQQSRPELRGRPVAVVPVETDSTSCIAASYEAKAFGVRTGTNVGDARRMCPGIVLVKGRPDLYVRTHHAVIDAIDRVLPVAGVHSIDEFSCRLLGAERERARAEALALDVKRSLRERVGACLTCSAGVAPNRFLAKVAADMRKPDGLTIIERHELPRALHPLRLIELPGIGPKMQERLRRRGIETVEQLCALDEGAMRRAWESVVGEEWYHRLRGADLRERATTRRTIGHSHVLSPERRADDKARAVAVRLLTKLGARARHLGYVAAHLTLSVRYFRPRAHRAGPPWQGSGCAPGAGGAPGFPDGSAQGILFGAQRGAHAGGTAGAGGGPPERWHATAPLPAGCCCDTPSLIEAFAPLWARRPRGPVLKLGVTLTDLTPARGATGALFQNADALARLSGAMDTINRKWGSDTLYPASMQDARKSAPRRIAFGNIPDLDVPDVGDEDE